MFPGVLPLRFLRQGAWLVVMAFSGCHSSKPEPLVPPEPGPANSDAGLLADIEPVESTPEVPLSPEPDAGAPGHCATDDDCVPKSCCHPSACVVRASAPACDGVMCTMECRAKTIDCGGRCLCRKGLCTALVNSLAAR